MGKKLKKDPKQRMSDWSLDISKFTIGQIMYASEDVVFLFKAASKLFNLCEFAPKPKKQEIEVSNCKKNENNAIDDDEMIGNLLANEINHSKQLNECENDNSLPNDANDPKECNCDGKDEEYDILFQKGVLDHFKSLHINDNEKGIDVSSSNCPICPSESLDLYFLDSMAEYWKLFNERKGEDFSRTASGLFKEYDHRRRRPKRRRNTYDDMEALDEEDDAHLKEEDDAHLKETEEAVLNEEYSFEYDEEENEDDL